MQTNRAAGQQLILQACNAGHLDACVGYAQIGGPQGRTVEADKAIAFALGKACSLGDGQSCYSVAYRLDPSTAFRRVRPRTAVIGKRENVLRTGLPRAQAPERLQGYRGQLA